MSENGKGTSNRRVSELASSFDPLEWAEKRRLAMAKASELRDQRRARAVRAHPGDPKPDSVGRTRSSSSEQSGRVRVVRAESRDSRSTAGERDGVAWEIDLSAPPLQSVPASGVEPPRHVAQSFEKKRLLVKSQPSARPAVAAATGRSQSRLAKPPVPSARMRAVTSPAERRKPLIDNVTKPRVPLRPGSATLNRPVRQLPKPQPGGSVSSRRPSQPSQPAQPSHTSKDPVTRQMIDRDTLRLENRAMFERAIAYWRTELSVQRKPATEHSQPGGHDHELRTHVYVRKRPLFDKERQQGREFDVVTVASPHTIVTHNCLFQADLKTPYLTHSEFNFSGCFDEAVSNEEVFAKTSLRVVDKAKRGGIGTIFCFGQTGSGKTHTMTALQETAAIRLFPQHAEAIEGTEEARIQIVELCGKRVFDLLSVGEKQVVKLRESGGGGLVLDGASCVTVASAGDLSRLMSEAQARRNTECTGANDVSSRSHAVAIISLPGGGKLTLVDLAGSERRKDSMWHDRERQKEGAEINASLHALKECIRTSGRGDHKCVAFRLSTLTRVLAETFTSPRALLTVIATVSPCATDIEHTVNTLKTVQQLTGGTVEESRQTEMFPKPQVEARTHPKRWNPDQVQQWLQLAGGCEGISKSTTGAMLVRMPETRFVQACGGDEKTGNRIFRNLHDLIRSGLAGSS